jgi:hypothetical protein
MTLTKTQRRMQEILLDAYDHPEQPAVFYAASPGAEPASERLQRMEPWDWHVQPHRVVPGAGLTCNVPRQFGCPEKPFSDGRGTWVEPIIHDPEQVDAIAIPDVHTGVTGEVLAKIRKNVANRPDEVQIRQPDVQSPLGIAELMWDESFYVAMLESPDAVHSLLAKITDFQIAYVRAIRDAAGQRLNAAGFPIIWSDATGSMMSDDSMTLISPQMHAEFSVPYLNRFAEAVGPLYYHSCSWREKYFDNIKSIGPVRTWNWNPGNSDDPAAIIRAFAGKAVLAPHIVKDMHRDKDLLAAGVELADEVELVRYFLDAAEAAGNACVMFWLSNVITVEGVIDRIYDLFHERGYTPAARGLI